MMEDRILEIFKTLLDNQGQLSGLSDEQKLVMYLWVKTEFEEKVEPGVEEEILKFSRNILQFAYDRKEKYLEGFYLSEISCDSGGLVSVFLENRHQDYESVSFPYNLLFEPPATFGEYCLAIKQARLEEAEKKKKEEEARVLAQRKAHYEALKKEFERKG